MYIFIKDTLIFHTISEQFCKSLVALEPCTIYSVKFTDVFAFLQKDTDYICSFARLIASRYGILLQQILKFGVEQEEGSLLIRKFATLTDIASMLNVHRSNVTSYINELEADGIIARHKRQLFVKDIDALALLVEETSS